jgi:hypothetical protein
MEGCEMDEFLEVSLTGHALLDNPLLSKGTLFPEDERREFGLLGNVVDIWETASTMLPHSMPLMLAFRSTAP